MLNYVKNYWALIIPVVVAAVGLIVFHMFTFQSVEALPKNFSPDFFNKETVKYPYWVATTFMLLVLSSIGAVSVTAREVSQSKDDASKVVFLIIAVLLLIGCYIGLVTIEQKALYESLGKDVFNSTVGEYLSKVGYKPGDEECGNLCLLKSLIDWSNFFAFAAAAFVASAVATLVPNKSQPPNNPTAPDLQKWVDNEVAELASRIGRLKLFLYAATVVLVTGVVSMNTWRRWPMAFATENPDKTTNLDVYKALADASVQMQAIHFVFILAAIFAPMAFVLKRRANEIVKHDGGLSTDTARKDFLLKRGADFDFKNKLTQLLSILAPYLAAWPIPELIRALI